MTEKGHAVGSHGITHDAHLFYQSPKAPVKEMTEDQQTIADVTGVHSQLVRVPYGSIPYLTDPMRNQLSLKNFKVWDWNIDSRDWEFMSSKYVGYTISQIVHAEQSGETPIVLLHDKPETIKYLPGLLKYLKTNSYQTKILTNDMAPYTFRCEGRCYPINGR
ncbi:polysaccharide deacetylase family protein [Virgibacillus halophilus]|uniref:Polysaccharide deacetylase family protein n=2 Tax=Tigheibacillus halophilus TaxID=361280 RepID=A0ABU5C2M9_9BACI|nr:polysaccharide deacetylase family protein [Virgibacillus halophilus]